MYKRQTYSPANAYEVGQTIFHENWDDFGKVVAKEILSNGQKSISVEFQKLGNKKLVELYICLLYTSDAADERSSVDLGGRRIIKKKKKKQSARHRKRKNKQSKD